MSTPRLSICIPTYNFGAYLGETLDSILSQVTPDVEIVVLDSNSTDDTESVVRGRQAPEPRLRYVRADERGGIDRDMARVVTLASGEYCWLFSADDVMVPGAVAAILKQMETSADVYVCRHGNTDKSMKVLTPAHPVLSTVDPVTFRMSDPTQRNRYFELAATTEAFFSFMGSLVVRRSRWESIPIDEEFVGSCWAHVARLFQLFDADLTVSFVSDVLLQRRGDNDSFLTQGVVRRYALAIEGFVRLGRHFFPDDAFKQAQIRRVLRREFKIRDFLYARHWCSTPPHRQDGARLAALFAELYADTGVNGKIASSIFHFFPLSFYSPLKAAFHAMAKPVRAMRAKHPRARSSH